MKFGKHLEFKDCKISYNDNTTVRLSVLKGYYEEGVVSFAAGGFMWRIL